MHTGQQVLVLQLTLVLMEQIVFMLREVLIVELQLMKEAVH